MNKPAPPIRNDLATALEQSWQRLSACGVWWSGEQRLAIAAEARQARTCPLCIESKTSLSPHIVKGSHTVCTDLPPGLVEVAHRVRTDAGRLTEKWYKGSIEAGLLEGEYVEAVGVVATITALDTFDETLGAPLRKLPEAGDGTPVRRVPAGAKRNLAWMPTVAPEDLADGDINPYVKHGHLNIHRALSLVPQEVVHFFDLDVALYLNDKEIRDFDNEYRALSHAQIELMAGRVSAIDECFY